MSLISQSLQSLLLFNSLYLSSVRNSATIAPSNEDTPTSSSNHFTKLSDEATSNLTNTYCSNIARPISTNCDIKNENIDTISQITSPKTNLCNNNINNSSKELHSIVNISQALTSKNESAITSDLCVRVFFILVFLMFSN
jgi:hypothetical protein